jgi:hypothetical protein
VLQPVQEGGMQMLINIGVQNLKIKAAVLHAKPLVLVADHVTILQIQIVTQMMLILVPNFAQLVIKATSPQ